jgi:hypothetical protein
MTPPKSSLPSAAVKSYFLLRFGALFQCVIKGRVFHLVLIVEFLTRPKPFTQHFSSNYTSKFAVERGETSVRHVLLRHKDAVDQIDQNARPVKQ